MDKGDISMVAELALFGGSPALGEELPTYNSMGSEEIEAVVEVVRSGCISGFFGSPGPYFLGGPKVQEFEQAFKLIYNARHAISVNSNTSGLIAAMGAIGISPGDEVIVPPYTMSATVVAPLFYGGIPVFADIEDQTFCIDPQSVLKNITEKTKAIIAVNLFGHPAQLATLKTLCDERGIFLIEDNAQAPRSYENQQWTGTIGHIGVFSLNYHKHIHTGEGGICLTNDDRLARRLALIRNHGENVVEALGESDLTNMIGSNMRMTELQAALGLCQIAQVERHVKARELVAEQLSQELKDLDGITVPTVRSNCRHNYYCWPLRYDPVKLGLSRETFCKALTMEGFPHRIGYLAPLYMLPVFQKRLAIGREGFPFTLTSRTYQLGLCPVAERLETSELILYLSAHFHPTPSQVEKMISAFRKVYHSIPRLRELDTVEPPKNPARRSEPCHA